MQRFDFTARTDAVGMLVGAEGVTLPGEPLIFLRECFKSAFSSANCA